MIERLDLPAAALVVPLSLLACGAADAVWWFWARRPPGMPWVAVTAMTAIYVGALVWVVPAFEEQKVVRDLAQWVAEAAEPDVAVLEARGAHLRIVKARSGMSVTSGMALWREKSAPTRFVVVTHAEPRHKRGRG